MIVLEINGPKNDEVLPITPKKEKKRNSLPRGVTSDICHDNFIIHLASKYNQKMWTDHSL